MFLVHKTMFCVPDLQILSVHTYKCTNPNLRFSILCFSVKVADVNGELSDSQEEENGRSAVTAEDAQATQELLLEAEPVIQNGTAEEIEAEGEAQVNCLVWVKVKVILLHDLSKLYTLPFGSFNFFFILLLIFIFLSISSVFIAVSVL